MGIPLQLMDDKNAVSIFTTESAATPIPTDDYSFPVNTEDAKKSDHRVPPKDSKVFAALAAWCQPISDFALAPMPCSFYSSVLIYMMLII